MDVVIGSGVGGLCAAIALRRAGRAVTLLEARSEAGGLASGFQVEGHHHDGGPYILLDRPGLEWAFRELGLDLHDHVELIALDEVYRVHLSDAPTLRIFRDLDRTAEGLERDYPGAAVRYRAFVRAMALLHGRLSPLRRTPHRGARDLVARGLLREGAFLLRGLGHHLAATGLPHPVLDALGIWTHIAGQSLQEAPAPLAFVPAIVHTIGAYTVRGGIARIPAALAGVARDIGVEVRFDARVDRIVRDGRKVLGVEVAGERIPAERVFSDAPGISTYTRLLDPPDPALTADLTTLPLQSPGVAAFFHADVGPDVPFLQFYLPTGADEKVRLLIHAGAVDPDRRGTLRLLSPTDHAWAHRVGPEGQREHLKRLLAEPWWQEGVGERTIVASRIPAEWGAQFHLHQDSMNPTMTAAFMRRGRLPHRSPIADNLFLCGSSTHPGQWVSFCAISGILAVQQADHPPASLLGRFSRS